MCTNIRIKIRMSSLICVKFLPYISRQSLRQTYRLASKATDWFKMNNMIVNPKKFQAIVINKKDQNDNPTEVNFVGKRINSESSILLFGLEIDSKLNFNKRISKLCNNSAGYMLLID